MQNINQNLNLKEIQERIAGIWQQAFRDFIPTEEASQLTPVLNQFQKVKIAYNIYQNQETDSLNILKPLNVSKNILKKGFDLLQDMKNYPTIQKKWIGGELGKKYSIAKLWNEKEKIKKQNQIIEKASLYVPTPEITFLEGDFIEKCKEIPNNSVDLGITDPLYALKYIHLLKPMAEEYSRILKPGAYFLMYFGGINEKEVFDSICTYLTSYTTISLVHEGTGQIIPSTDIIAAQKPIYVFYKAPKRTIKPFKNVLYGKKDSKEFHDYGQSVYESCELIKMFSNPRDTVCDLFGGGGTTAIACAETGRNCIISEKDPLQIQIIKGRLADLFPSNVDGQTQEGAA